MRAQVPAETWRLASQTTVAAVGREARCKAAFCLLRLNREGEAARLLEEVAADEARDNWPLVAISQLLLLRLSAHHFDADTDAAGTIWAATDAGRKALARTKADVAELNTRLTEGFSDAEIDIVSRWLTSVQGKFPRGDDE